MSHLRKWYIILYKTVFNLLYHLLVNLREQDDEKVVIALYRSNELEGNLKFIYDELKKQLPNSKIHLVVGENKMNLKLFKEIILLSNARYLILDDYYLPVYLIKPDVQLKIIQLWHAAGAFKKFGYSTVGTKFGPSKDYLRLVPIHSNYTHVYVSSENAARFYAEAFHMPLKHIFPLGIPRTDLFHNKVMCNETIELIQQDYPILKGKVNILLAPTYRAKGSQGESTFDIIDTLIELSKEIANDKVIIFKAHPYMNEWELNRLKVYKNIFIANKYSINEWMLVSDAFITDYSSAVFEYSILNRPLAHFIPDLDEYEMNRGFYEPIKVVSDAHVLTDTGQLLDWINSRKQNEHFDTSRMVRYNFNQTNDVTKKIVNHFFSDKKEAE